MRPVLPAGKAWDRPGHPRRATLTVGSRRGGEHGGSEGSPMTVGVPHGQSAYEPEPGGPLDYVGHGFKRVSRDRDRLGSAGGWGGSFPLFFPHGPKSPS